ncbi:endonuclease/exonuclease/phosphatase family protein [Kribbella solani]|nr:endonuclease/exonuclease/phosphatase family protein [Kribbella solani]MDX2970058.1 endonuclease/exonuclease/phosphatase family protein [Kribbella solani]
MEPRGGFRVLSYNVHRWGDDRVALERVVRGCRPDVMLVQEAPTWWGTRRKRRAMAASFGMRYVAASARNAILVADGIELTGIRGRRTWRPFVRRRLDFIATQLPGGTVGGVVHLGSTRVAVVVCHLGLHPRGRIHELAQVLSLCNSFGTPYLLTGDLNEEPDGPIWKRLAEEGLTDLGADAGPTFNSSTPYKRIDGALLSTGPTRNSSRNALPPLTARLRHVPATREDLAAASDHLPMLVELSLSASD